MIARSTPLRRTGRIAAPRRDCRNCDRRVEKREQLWWHVTVKAQSLCPTPDPYPTKRTPKASSKNKTKDRKLRLATVFGADGEPLPCANCGGTYGVEAAHIIPRSQSRAVHWNPDNILPLCEGPGTNGCHHKFDRHLIDRLGLIERTIGLDAYRVLNVAAARAPERGIP